MRRKHREEMSEFRLSLVSLLDLVFNILAFFVMTYRPPEQTKDYQVNLPPPKEVESHASSETMFAPRNPEKFKDISIGLEAGDGGVLSAISIEGKAIPLGDDPMSAITREIVELNKKMDEEKVDRIVAVNIVADPRLKYRYILPVVEACTKKYIDESTGQLVETGIEKVGFMPLR